MELEFKKTAQFAASRFKGSQCCVGFPAVGQGANIHDGVKEEFRNGNPSKGGRFVEATDNLAAENPKVVGMFADGAAGQSELDQMKEEGAKTVHELLTWRDVFGESHPSVGPFMQILAAGKPIKQDNGLGPVWGVRCGNGFLFRLLSNHGTDPHIKPLLPLSGIRV